MTIRRVLVVAVALGLVAAGCGRNDDLETDATPTTRHRFPAAVVPTSSPEPTAPFGGDVVVRPTTTTTRRAPTGGAARTSTAVTPAPRVPPEPTPLTSPRRALGGVGWQGLVVVAGGAEADGDVVARVDSYDPATAQWKLAPRLPMALHDVVLGVLGDDLWAIGGFSVEGDQSVARAETYVFHPGADEWESGPLLNTARGGAAVATLGSTLVVAGGVTTDGAALDSVETLALGGTKWIAGPALARKRAYASAVVEAGRVYVAGGRTDGAGSSLRSVESWKAGGNWRAESALGAPRSAGASAGPCVGGGENGDGAVASVECLADGKWSRRFTLRTPRRGLAAAAVDGWLHLVGGATSGDATVVDGHEVFDLAS